MNGGGRCGRACIEVDVKRLHERLVDGAALRHDLLSPVIHNHPLYFRRTWIVDPSVAFARDPIQRLAALAGHEKWDFASRGLGDEGSPQQFTAIPANGLEVSAMGLAYHFAAFSKDLGTLFGINVECGELHRTIARSHP